MPDLMQHGVEAIAPEMHVAPGGSGGIEIPPDLIAGGQFMQTERVAADCCLPPDDVGRARRIDELEPEAADAPIDGGGVVEDADFRESPILRLSRSGQNLAFPVAGTGCCEVAALAEIDLDRLDTRVPGGPAPDQGIDEDIPVSGARHSVSDRRHRSLVPRPRGLSCYYTVTVL